MLLERHPGVAEACVFGLPDPTSGEMVAAAIRPASGANVSQEDLRDWCLERLRRDAIPERWFIVEQIPRNSRGKVSRTAVRDLFHRHAKQGRVDAAVELLVELDRAELIEEETGGRPAQVLRLKRPMRPKAAA